MTGNWWFPFDIFVVPQGNGDVHLYAPGIVAAVYQWDVVGQTFTSPQGMFDVMVSNAGGTWTRTTKYGDVWQFNSSGNLTSITNRYGLVQTYNRNAQQAITSIVDYAGRVTTVTYNAAGYASGISDWGGRTVTLAYTPQGYLSSVTFPATTFYDRQTQSIVTRGKTLTFTYTTGTSSNLDGNLLTAVDDRGKTMYANGYDAGDRIVTGTQRGRTWTYEYQLGGTTKVTDPDGVTAVYTFDGAGAIIRKEVFTRTGLGQTALRTGEPNSYVWQYERNAACSCDFVSKITYPSGATRSYTYDQWGNMLSDVMDPAPGGSGSQIKETWTWSSFAQFCQILSHTTPGGYVAGATAADHTSTWTRDAKGTATQVQWPKTTINGALQHPVVTFVVNSVGQQTSRTWPSGRKDTFEYATTTLDRTKATHDVLGTPLVTQYVQDAYGRLVSQTNPRGYSTAYTYNALDQITLNTPPQPKGAKRTYLYDNNGAVYRIETENKDSTATVDSSNPWFTGTAEYNDNNSLISVTHEIDGATTATTCFEHSPGGRLTKVTDPTGRVVEIQYDERGLPFKRIEAPGTAVAGTTTYNYSLDGNVSEIVDPRGHSTLMSHDHAGRLVAATLPDSTSVNLAYDVNGNVTMTELADSSAIVRRRATAAFDPGDQMVSTSRHHLNAAGTTTSTDTTTYVYDSGQRLQSVTDPMAGVTSYQWTAVSWLSTVTDAATNKVEIFYDGNGNPVQVKRSDYNQATAAFDVIVQEFVYDELDRRTAATRRDPATTLSAVTSAEYDGRGLATKFTDELGNTTLTEWDGLGRVLKSIRELRAGGTGAGAVNSTIDVVRVYDLAGRLTSIADGKSQATTYEHDDRGRVKKVTNAAAQATTISYDLNGNALTVTQPTGTVVSNTWDALNRLTARTATPGTGVIGDTSMTMVYDALGQITSIVDNDSTVARTYDSLGRMITETQGPNPVGGNGKTFSYSYNARDDLVGITYPDGTIENRTTDVIGRPTSVAIQGGATLATYQFAGSRTPSMTLANGVTRTQTYDALLRNTVVEYAKAASIKKFEYVFDLAGNRLLEKRHHAGGSGDNYTLDSIYRSVTVKAGVADPVAEYQNPGSQSVASTTGVTYDAAQSRTQVVSTAGGTPTTTNYTSDALNFYTAVGGTTQVRDANGNLRDDGTNLYDYDHRNQLVRVRLKSDGSTIATYDYDATGRRIAKTVSGTTTSFYWVGLQMAMEYDAAGLVSRRHYGHEFGEVASAWQRDVADLDQDGSTTDYVPLTPLYDGAFDCVAVLGPTGAMAESYVHSYDGQVTISNAAGQTIGTTAVGWRQGYGRMYRDAETGWMYAVCRYYAPELGRFISEDPSGRWYDSSALGNAFAWASNRYRNAWDPLGLADAVTPFWRSVRDTADAAHEAGAGDSDLWDLPTPNDEGGICTHCVLRELAAATKRIKTIERVTKKKYEAMTTPHHEDSSKYHLLVNMDYWKDLKDYERLFLLLHEMLHAALHRCGTSMRGHHSDDIESETYIAYQRHVLRTFKIIRKHAKGKFNDVSDEDMAKLEAKWGAKPKKPNDK